MKLSWLIALSLLTVLGTTARVAASGDVFSLVRHHCASCHQAGGEAPFSLTEEKDIVRRSRHIAEVIARGDMPPWQPLGDHGVFAGDSRLTDEEKALVSQWQAEGFPKPDPSDPTDPTDPPAKDWPLGPPDVIVEVPEPIRVPAAGPGAYRSVRWPLKASDVAGFRTVRAVAIRPSSRAVHHAMTHISSGAGQPGLQALLPAPQPPGLAALLPAARRPAWEKLVPPGAKSPPGMLDILTQASGGWAPGFRPALPPPGQGWTLPKQPWLHLTLWTEPTGKTEHERTEVGLYLASERLVQEKLSLPLRSYRIYIPAGSRSSEAKARFITPVPLTLHGLTPHARRLAMMVSLTVALPDQAGQPLLRIKEWDAGSQRPYDLAQPMECPAGTRFDLCVRYDNSSRNIANPHTPARHVRMGAGDDDEMASLLLHTTLHHPTDRPQLLAALRDACDRQYDGLLSALEEGPQAIHSIATPTP
jgi:hypothetical protein